MSLLDNPIRVKDSFFNNQDSDFFEHVEAGDSEIDEIKEILNEKFITNDKDLETSGSENIPDIDDFDEPNLLIHDDQVILLGSLS